VHRLPSCHFICCAIALVASIASAAHPGRSAIDLAFTAEVGYGNEVFAAGDHPDFTLSGHLPHGIKLRWTAGNIWRGRVAIRAGETAGYRFVKRPGDHQGYCTGTTTDLSGELDATVPPLPGPNYSGKTIRYTSAWGSAWILYRNNSTGEPWTDAAMRRVADGRTPSESIFEADLPAGAGDEIEFVFHNDASQYDNAPAPPENTPQGAAPARPAPYQSLNAPYNYRCNLDVIHVQDGDVFSYRPPTAPGVPRIETRSVGSTADTIPGRTIKIYLPRGYDQNTWKRYPVVYFHDGQNVFFPGGTFGTWDADRIATYEISQGRMREAILVAVDNGNDYGSDRRREYVPPTDSLSGVTGAADRYAEFLWENVLPTLDYNYRTLNEPGQPSKPRENIVVGSSLGGLVTSYLGTEWSSMFGRIGIFSPAFWAAPNFRSTRLIPSPKLPLEIYMDIGSQEISASMSDSAVYWNDAQSVYNAFLDDAYAVNSELLFWPECGGNHNETAWSRRLPVFFGFALDPWDDPQWLAAELYPPRLDVVAIDPIQDTATISLLRPLSVPITIERTTDFSSWTQWAAPSETALPWEAQTLTGDLPTGSKHFWRATFSPPNLAP
jgi:predicted alpha/beta superfamily hydrolase